MSERLPRIEGKDLVRALKKTGFAELRQRGSHLHLYREADRRRVTVPMHAGRILPPGMLSGILRDAGVTVEELVSLL